MISSAVNQRLKAGDMVAGRFRIVEPIGSGGFSVVYRAHQESMNRFVALKVLKSSASSNKQTVERFRREALFASYLSHPNTIRLFDYGHTDDGMCYIAMELLEGQDLADVLQFGEPVGLSRVWSILFQCSQSLAEAHRIGVIHRDLKPENIYLVPREDGSDFVKVLDFGVSKAVGDFANHDTGFKASLTQKGTVFGTPLYMAPEQAMDQELSAASDVYALGHIAYEMITGKAAYSAELTAMDVMLRQINDPPLKLPAPLDRTPFSPLITKCTLKDPAARIPDTARLLEHLLHDAFSPYMPAGFAQTRAESPAGSASGVPPTRPAPRAKEPAATRVDEPPATTEIFEDLEPPQPRERDAADVAFDTVLGFLAELGESIPLQLWTLARARVIPQEYRALADFMVEQAERYGIVDRGVRSPSAQRAGEGSIWFTKPGYSARLRANFDQLVEPTSAHRDLAQLILSFDPTPQGALLERAVEHLRRGGQTHQAMRLLWQSTIRASAAADFRAALEHCTALLRLIEEIGPKNCEQAAENLGFRPAKVWMRAAELHISFNEVGAAQDALARVVDPALNASSGLRGLAYKMLGDMAVSQERYAQARAHYQRGRDCFREAKFPGAFVAAIGAMGQCALLEGNYSEAIELLSLALNRADRLGDTLLSARLSRYMARALMRTAAFSKAAERLAAAFEHFKGAASELEVTQTLLELGEANFAAGDYDAAQRYYRRALTLDGARERIVEQRSPEFLSQTDPANPAEYSTSSESASPENGLGHALAAMGALDEAADYYQQAFTRALAQGDRLEQARAQFYLGDLALARADFSAAERYYHHVQDLAQRLGQTELWVDAAIRLAYLAAERGHREAGYDQLSAAVEWAEAARAEDAEIRCRAHLVYLQLIEHGFRARGGAFNQLRARAEGGGHRRALTLCWILSADVYAARGERAAAEEALELARGAAAELQDFSLLLPIRRREARLADPGSPAGAGVAIGSLLAPKRAAG